MKVCNKIVFFVFFVFLKSVSFAQYNKKEAAPPNIDWLKIKSENFVFYFPKELDSIAQRSVSFLEKNIHNIKINPSDKIRRSKIILHNQNVIPNAFVSSSPRRSEFFINAKAESPHFLHNNSWSDLISTHEFRHLVQREVGYNSFFNKAVHYVFGEGLSSMLTRAAMPNWYWEGDAVYSETSTGDFGRGRVPAFLLTTQNNVLSGRKISYDRQTLGSFKYKTPNEYETGYLMVNYLNESYGEETYNNIVANAHRGSYFLMPFYRSLKKETKKNYKEIYKESLVRLPSKKTSFSSDYLNVRNNSSYYSLLYPTEISGERVVVIRQGYGSYQDFRIIEKTGSVSLLFTPGVINDFGRIPSAKNTIAWLEYEKDPRWDKRVYSRVKVLDVNTKKLLKTSLRGFFSSVDLSPDGNFLLVSVNNLNGSQSFEIYELKTLIKKHSWNWNEGVVSSLKYSNENSLIGLKTKNGKKEVFLFDLNLKKNTTIYTTHENIGWPNIINNSLFFSSAKDGFEEIFEFDLSSRKLYLLEGKKLGSYYPNISKDNKSLYYSSMGLSGFDVYQIKIGDIKKTEIMFKEKNKINEVVFELDKNYQTQKANIGLNIFQPISWGISDFGFSENGLDDITLGLESVNLFGTLMFSGGYKIDTREKKNKRFFNLSYQGLYPVFDLSFSSSKDFFYQDIIISRNGGVLDTIKGADINYKTNEFSSNVKIPLSYSNGKYFSSFVGSLGVSVERFKDFYTTTLSSESGRFPLKTARDKKTFVSSSIIYSRKHKKSSRQVYNPYEQSMLLEGLKTIGSSNFVGAYVRSDLYLAFPGIKNLHSTRLKFRAEAQDIKDYIFKKNITFIYGYDNVFNFSKFYGWGVEYELPLMYPDLSLGPIVFIKRVRGYGFVNGGIIRGADLGSEKVRDTPKSLGFGFNFDINLFRQNFLFNAGVRYSYVVDSPYSIDKSKIEIRLGSISF